MKTRIILKVIPLVLFAQILFAQSDNIGSGRAINFDGVDDFIDLGNVYDDLKLPLTISAWINIDQSVSTWAPVFVSQDNSPIYNGFWFIVQPTRISIGYGDGQGENSLAFRRSKIAEMPNISGRWVHICATIRGAVDMNIFVNGIDVGGAYSGFSDLPMSTTTIDVAKIGYWFSNSEVFRFKGSIDEVRLWNRSLSISEVRELMCKQIVGTSSGLIGLWNFNETNAQIFDQSENGYNGILQGSPLRQFSGAPIGNESRFNYVSGLVGQNFSFGGPSTISVTDITGNPQGIQVYKVDSPPSIQAGLTGQSEMSKYYGVFLASLDNNNRYNIELLDQTETYCNLFARNSNNSSPWLYLDNPQIEVLQRGEYLIATGIETPFDLGDRIIICQGETQNIDTGIIDEDVSILWSTGATTPNILVNTAGVYTVEVSGPCGSIVDQVEVVVNSPPPYFSFGADEVLCILSPIILKPYVDADNYEYLWQDGSNGSSIEILDFGVYWVEVKNSCGSRRDTITYSKLNYEFENIPNVITPNGDSDNEFFKLSSDAPIKPSILIIDRWGLRVFESFSYKNDWSAAGLSPGVYYYRLTGPCINEAKGSISVLR